MGGGGGGESSCNGKKERRGIQEKMSETGRQMLWTRLEMVERW